MNRTKSGEPLGRAQGLMQVMPFWFPGVTLDFAGELTEAEHEFCCDPERNVSTGDRILWNNYQAYHSWEMAARAYFGFGTDSTGANDDLYAERFRTALAKYEGLV